MSHEEIIQNTDLPNVELIPGQPHDGIYDVLICVIDSTIDSESVKIWVDWANESGPKNGWSFRCISVVNDDEGLVLGSMSLELIRGAVLSGLSVGIFSPTSLGAAISIVAAYKVIFESFSADDALKTVYDSHLIDYEETRGQSYVLIMNRLVSAELRSSLSALEIRRDSARKVVSPLTITSFNKFQKLHKDRECYFAGSRSKSSSDRAGSSHRISSPRKSSPRNNDVTIMQTPSPITVTTSAPITVTPSIPAQINGRTQVSRHSPIDDRGVETRIIRASPESVEVTKPRTQTVIRHRLGSSVGSQEQVVVSKGDHRVTRKVSRVGKHSRRNSYEVKSIKEEQRLNLGQGQLISLKSSRKTSRMSSTNGKKDSTPYGRRTSAKYDKYDKGTKEGRKTSRKSSNKERKHDRRYMRGSSSHGRSGLVAGHTIYRAHDNNHDNYKMSSLIRVSNANVKKDEYNSDAKKFGYSKQISQSSVVITPHHGIQNRTYVEAPFQGFTAKKAEPEHKRKQPKKPVQKKVPPQKQARWLCR